MWYSLCVFSDELILCYIDLVALYLYVVVLGLKQILNRKIKFKINSE